MRNVCASVQTYAFLQGDLLGYGCGAYNISSCPCLGLLSKGIAPSYDLNSDILDHAFPTSVVPWFQELRLQTNDQPVSR